jgi:hypothetical protein
LIAELGSCLHALVIILVVLLILALLIRSKPM